MKKDVRTFNFWASKPKETQPTRTIQDVKSGKKNYGGIGIALICCPCSGCDSD